MTTTRPTNNPCTCPHCTTPDTQETPAPPPTVPNFLAIPTPIRIHYPDGHTQDCTLHPDGHFTMQLPNGEVLRNAFSLEEMCEQNWEGCRIELGPLPLEPAPPGPERPVMEQPPLPAT
ncbi:hypothetical protein [Streptomyces sp. ST2-7A]|uniref:hypothetical protein n=1 Tax=Streptomyces sp. ST2-7A TaxID=2907214 RepID=UPI001F2F83C8|nr:hypothetical protein [Streptomyces sp. ST2-7A]MCE7083467.1 hypothetical protein [Streptomyces sp. ST2-7A]